MSDNDVTPGAGGDRPLTDEERARLYREQVKRLHTLDLVRALLADIVTLAYQKLGLTDETADLRDLGDVRAAIETVRRLVEVLESEGAADEARTYRSTLAAMQLQFASAAAGPPAGPAEGTAESGTPAAARQERDTSEPVAQEPVTPEPAAPERPAAPMPDTGRAATAKKVAATKKAAATKQAAGAKQAAATKKAAATKQAAGAKQAATAKKAAATKKAAGAKQAGTQKRPRERG